MAKTKKQVVIDETPKKLKTRCVYVLSPKERTRLRMSLYWGLCQLTKQEPSGYKKSLPVWNEVATLIEFKKAVHKIEKLFI